MKGARLLGSLYRIHLKALMPYRFTAAMFTVGHAVTLFGCAMYWRYLLAASQTSLFGDENTVLWYFLMSFFLGTLLSDTVAFNIGEEINNGKFSSHMMMPVSYTTLKACDFAAGVTVHAVLLLAALPVIAYFAEIPARVVLAFVVHAVLSCVFFFYYAMMLGLVSLWYRQASGVAYLQQVLVPLLSGMLAPLHLISRHPIWLYNPFALSLYHPVAAFVARKVDVRGVLLMSVWTLLARLAYSALRRRAAKRYRAYGG